MVMRDFVKLSVYLGVWIEKKIHSLLQLGYIFKKNLVLLLLSGFFPTPDNLHSLIVITYIYLLVFTLLHSMHTKLPSISSHVLNVGVAFRELKSSDCIASILT